MSPTSSANPPAPTAPCLAPPEDQTRWFHDEVHPHRAKLTSYLQRQFPAVHESVDDVVQESFLRIWRARAARPIVSAKGFLFAVARRLAIDLVRRQRRSPFVPVKDISQLFVFDANPDARQSAHAAADAALLVRAIEALPARCRQVFVLCQIEGLPHKEVAARLGIAESTVAVLSARGLHRCEQFVREGLNR